MRSTEEVVAEIVERFRKAKLAQVAGYNRFTWVGETPSALVVGREAGKDTRVPRAVLAQAVEAARADPAVYGAGPGRLADHGIKYINSPVWALLHLCEQAELSK